MFQAPYGGRSNKFAPRLARYSLRFPVEQQFARRVDSEDYHWQEKPKTMQMKNPNHPGDIIRNCLDELGVNVTDAARALGVTRAALSRVLNRKAAVSAKMAIRLERRLAA